MNAREQRITFLLDQIETMLARSERLVGRHLPRWRRALGAVPAACLLRRVRELMDEVNALRGYPRPAETLLGIGRDGWRLFQFVLGVLNAWAAIDSASKAQWFSMIASVVWVCLTACWTLPYKPPRYINRIDKKETS